MASALVRLVRDHAQVLSEVPEDAERDCAPQLARELLVVDPMHPLDVLGSIVQQMLELPAADDPERDLGREAGRLGSSPARVAGSACRRTGLGREGVRAPTWVEEPVLAPTKQTSTFARGISPTSAGKSPLALVPRRRGRPSQTALSTAASARAVNERDEYRPRSLTMVSCRDERIEDERPATRRPTSPRHVEVAGVPDQHDVVLVSRYTTVAPRPASAQADAVPPQLSRLFSRPARMTLDDLRPLRAGRDDLALRG